MTKLRMKSSIRPEVVMMFMVALALLIGIGAAIFLSLLHNEENDYRVSHTHRVIETLESLISNIKDVEIGQRAYLITADTSFYTLFKMAKQQTDKDFKQLQELTKDNTYQKLNLRKLQSTLAERFAFLDKGPQKTLTQDKSIIFSQHDKALMQSIRSQVSQMITLERRLMDLRIHKVEGSTELSRWIFMIGFLVILSLLVASFYLINQEMNERQRAQGKLTETNYNLENMVELRTQALEAAKRNSETLAAEREIILNQLLEGVVVTDASGKIVLVNEAAARLHGVNELDISPQAYSDTYHLFTAEGSPYPFEELPLTRAVMNDETIFDAHWRIRRPDGTELMASGNARPVYGPDNNKIGAVLTIRDDTAREAVQKALKESEEQFRTMAESIPQLAWMTYADGSIYWYNQRWYNYTGTTLDDMRGWGWQKVHHPDYVNPVTEKFKQAVKAGQPWEDTFPLRARNGQYRWFLSRAQPVCNQQGDIVRWFGSNTDITELLETQEKLRQQEEEVRKLNETLECRVEERTEQLLAINKELESFSYSVSHDLRAPLRSIDGFSQALVEDYGNQLDDVGKDFLQRVRKESQRMGHLIDDLLNLSRLTRGEMNKIPVDLSAMVTQVANTLQKLDPDRENIRFIIQPDVQVMADENLIQAMIENLLGNAWKFTSHHLQACIEFGVQSNKNGEKVYYIKDDGAGFNMAYVDKLFGAFQRLHAASEFSGSGIGLATVQRIVHRHGGKIWAEGAIEKGASFYFTLGQ